jgi:hypothetical protein
LIQTENRGARASEKISGIQLIVPEVLKQATVEAVAPALSNHADLSTGSGAKFRRIVVRLHAEFLYILHAGLQAEYAGNLTIEVTWVIADDAAALDSVVPDRILLVGPAIEAHIVEGSRSEIDSAWCHQVKLRNLPAVDGQVRDLAFWHVCPDGGRADVDDCQIAAGNLDFGVGCSVIFRVRSCPTWRVTPEYSAGAKPVDSPVIV